MKKGCNGRTVTVFINAAKKYYAKKHSRISQQMKPNQSIFKNYKLPTCQLESQKQLVILRPMGLELG